MKKRSNFILLQVASGENEEVPDAQDSTAKRELVAKIAAAYFRRNKVQLTELASLISTVYGTLDSLGKPAEDDTKRTPAVPIRRSVQPGHVVCLECGWRGQMLRRHLTAAHGLNPDEYRTRWGLPAAHPLTAPGYRERRADIAKLIGLGRNRGGARASNAHSGAQEADGDEAAATSSSPAEAADN